MHIRDGILRARLDGELNGTDALAVERHLGACARCRARLEEMEARAGRVNGMLAELSPPDAADAGAGSAWARLGARLTERAARRTAWRLPLSPAPLWSALAAAAVLVALLVSPPARAVAQRFLGMLRVRNVVAVPLDTRFLGEGKGKLIGQLLSDSIHITKEEPAQPAANREEANRLAGFTVRLPAARTDVPRFTVQGAHAFYFTAEAKRLEMLLGVLGRPDMQLPPGLDGAKVAVDIPRGVTASYGLCPQLGCVTVNQVPVPTVVTLPELDLAGIARAGLELAGMTPDEAAAYSRAVDWTSTLAIPVPRDAASYETVTVEGVSGVLATLNARQNLPPRWVLVWIRNGVVYSVTGFGSSPDALSLAGSMG